jgi:hypothetical protein
MIWLFEFDQIYRLKLKVTGGRTDIARGVLENMSHFRVIILPF